MNKYINGKVIKAKYINDFYLFSDVITVAIDANLQALWHSSYTVAIEISRRVAQNKVAQTCS